LKGFYPQAGLIAPTQYTTLNCFNLNTAPSTPTESVTNGDGGSELTFVFEPYLTGCSPNGGSGLDVISLGNGIYDTVNTVGTGGGGSESVKGETSNVKRVIVNPKTLYDSVCITMRYHNYASAKNKCYSLIDMYPDSLQSTATISKLFLALVASDTSSASMSNLKTYYENLILNHATNTALVKRCNYFVQKCKVRLHQYSSALSGFQQIIDQNPYGYDGLLARWDYMATTLLMSGGAGGENDNFSPYQGETERGSDGDDKSPFTKEQRAVINNTIVSALTDTRINDEKKIKFLEEKSKDGDQNAKQQLNVIRTLKQVVKTEHPKNIMEQIKIVSNDIQKIFGSNAGSKSKVQNSVPSIFKLHQSYPNPFNPTAIIKYDLPKDVKINIKVYDLLGRLVKTLVNEYKKAGYYEEKFDGANLASGVYFYRIEAGNFVDSKKMVLVK
jgi:hypothetical protein